MERLGRSHDVVHAAPPILEQPHHKLGEITHVDHLHRIIAPARHQHFSPARQALRPVLNRSVVSPGPTI